MTESPEFQREEPQDQFVTELKKMTENIMVPTESFTGRKNDRENFTYEEGLALTRRQFVFYYTELLAMGVPQEEAWNFIIPRIQAKIDSEDERT